MKPFFGLLIWGLFLLPCYAQPTITINIPKNNLSKIKVLVKSLPQSVHNPALGIILIPPLKIYTPEAVNSCLGPGNPDTLYCDYFKSAIISLILNKTNFSRVRFIIDSIDLHLKTFDLDKQAPVELKVPSKSLKNRPFGDVQYLLFIENYGISTLNKVTAQEIFNKDNEPSIADRFRKNPPVSVENNIQHSADVVMFNCENDTVVFYGRLNVNKEFTKISKSTWDKSMVIMANALFNKTPFVQ